MRVDVFRPLAQHCLSVLVQVQDNTLQPLLDTQLLGGTTVSLDQSRVVVEGLIGVQYLYVSQRVSPTAVHWFLLISSTGLARFRRRVSEIRDVHKHQGACCSCWMLSTIFPGYLGTNAVIKLCGVEVRLLCLILISSLARRRYINGLSIIWSTGEGQRRR